MRQPPGRHIGEILAAGEQVYGALKNLVVWVSQNDRLWNIPAWTCGQSWFTRTVPPLSWWEHSIVDVPAAKLYPAHATTNSAYGVRANRARMAATITPQIFNRNAIFEGGIRPHIYCCRHSSRPNVEVIGGAFDQDAE